MESAPVACPICSLARARNWIENEHAIAFAPADPIADGHMVIAPRKHVATVHALAADEQPAVWKLAGEVRNRLLIGLKPDSFDIGLVEHEAVEHDHIHIVPRRHGDALDMPSKIRWVPTNHAPWSK
jgi:diadenosine tetraphosphate (Ap4A) HIT family hydrolase